MHTTVTTNGVIKGNKTFNTMAEAMDYATDIAADYADKVLDLDAGDYYEWENNDGVFSTWIYEDEENYLEIIVK